MKHVPNKIRAVTEAVLKFELSEARRKLKLHADGPGKSYYMGMVDGMVIAMMTIGVPTTPEKPK